MRESTEIREYCYQEQLSDDRRLCVDMMDVEEETGKQANIYSHHKQLQSGQRDWDSSKMPDRRTDSNTPLFSFHFEN